MTEIHGNSANLNGTRFYQPIRVQSNTFEPPAAHSPVASHSNYSRHSENYDDDEDNSSVYSSQMNEPRRRNVRVQPPQKWMSKVLSVNKKARCPLNKCVIYYPTQLLDGHVYCRNACSNKLYPFRVGSAEEKTLFCVKNTMGPHSGRSECLYYSNEAEFIRHWKY